MTLSELILFLESCDKKKIVKNGFSTPHSDRGYYENLAFTPAEDVTIESMLEYSKSALGKEFYGWKGGLFLMTEFTKVFIGEDGCSGYEITYKNLKEWRS